MDDRNRLQHQETINLFQNEIQFWNWNFMQKIDIETSNGDSKSVELELRPPALNHRNQFGANKNSPTNSETKSVLLAEIKHIKKKIIVPMGCTCFLREILIIWFGSLWITNRTNLYQSLWILTRGRLWRIWPKSSSSKPTGHTFLLHLLHSGRPTKQWITQHVDGIYQSKLGFSMTHDYC